MPHRTVSLRIVQSAIVFVLVAQTICPLKAFGQGRATAAKNLFKAVTTVAAALAGAESLRKSGQSFEEYRHEDEILTRLRSQGIGTTDVSILSVYFKTTGGYWSDFWSKPDLFFVVDIEGQGTNLVPQIHYNYHGEPVLDVVVAKSLPPGTRIIVRVLDDDTYSDAMWNSILQSRVTVAVKPEIQATKFVSVSAVAIGSEIRLLDKSVTIDAPDFIAAAEFKVPASQDGRWVADSTLFDSAQNSVGTLQFASLWSAPQPSTAQQLAAQHKKVSTALGNGIFWGVLGVCLITWFGWRVVKGGSRQHVQKQKDDQPIKS